MIVIKTKKFALRPYRKKDKVSLAKNINDKKIYRNTLRIPYSYILKDAKEFIRKEIKKGKKLLDDYLFAKVK